MANTTVPINIGDYFQFGKYLNNPILWRCIDIDTNGPLLLSDKIIDFKSFDNKGLIHKYLNGTAQKDSTDFTFNKKNMGSGLWETSNLRSWLSSTLSAGNIKWLDGCTPSFSNKENYKDENGFLSINNFTLKELPLIKSVSQKSIVSSIDDTLKKGGTAEHIINLDIKTVIQNYDTTYYYNVTDKMFLLDVKQLNKIYLNSSTLGEKYWLAKMSKAMGEALMYFKYSFDKTYNPETIYEYYTRTTNNSFGVRIVQIDGQINGNQAYCTYGVRPAFYLNNSIAVVGSGKGIESDPYIFTQSSYTVIPVPPVITTPVTPPTPNPIAIKYPVAIGDYIKFGKYYGDPILWRCVALDDVGMLVMADEILTLKQFDMPGSHRYLDKIVQVDYATGNRTRYGSNLWETSSLRSWLNATETYDKIKWLSGITPPQSIKPTVDDLYARESGFLNPNNFTTNELAIIKSSVIKNKLGPMDSTKLKTGGTKNIVPRMQFPKSIVEDSNVFYNTSTDKMFILNLEQIKSVCANSSILGATYHMVKPTEKAFVNSPYLSSKGIDLSAGYQTLTRSVYNDSYIIYVMHVLGSTAKGSTSASENITSEPANGKGMGVRPAFYLSPTAVFKKGNGQKTNPWMLEGTDTTVPPKPPVTTTTSEGGFFVKFGKYNGDPILWRCLDINNKGMLLMSHYNLCCKCFDAAGNHTYLDGTPQADNANGNSLPNLTNGRTKVGSSLWQTSSIKSWLNSIASAGNVKWADSCIPNAQGVKDGLNAYDQEKGFLHQDNFTATEFNLIKSVKTNYPIPFFDKKLSEPTGGAGTCYYHSVEDKIFLRNREVMEVTGFAGSNNAKYTLPLTTEEKAINASKLNTLLSNCKDKYGLYLGGISNKYDGLLDVATPKKVLDVYFTKPPRATNASPYIGCLTGVPATYTTSLDAGIFTATRICNIGLGVGGTSALAYETKAIQPFCYIDKSAKFTSGDGTFNNPYSLSESNSNTKPTGDTTTSTDTTKITVGGYLKLGKIYGESIIWRCMDKDTNGPLMVSDKIIDKKAFDFKGTHKYPDKIKLQPDDADKGRTLKGSNMWETSTIRTWLNSTASANGITWSYGVIPSLANVLNVVSPLSKKEYYAYDKEAGFLNPNNFTSTELKCVKSVSQKCLLNFLDISLMNGGSTSNASVTTKIESVGLNYDKAYYRNVTDKMFFLDEKQLGRIFINAGILKSTPWLAYKTAKVDSRFGLKSGITFDYALRSPSQNKTQENFIRSFNTTCNQVDVSSVNYGIRPAFYLDEANTKFKSGTGTIDNPYTV